MPAGATVSAEGDDARTDRAARDEGDRAEDRAAVGRLQAPRLVRQRVVERARARRFPTSRRGFGARREKSPSHVARGAIGVVRCWRTPGRRRGRDAPRPREARRRGALNEQRKASASRLTQRAADGRRPRVSSRRDAGRGRTRARGRGKDGRASDPTTCATKTVAASRGGARRRVALAREGSNARAREGIGAEHPEAAFVRLSTAPEFPGKNLRDPNEPSNGELNYVVSRGVDRGVGTVNRLGPTSRKSDC